MENDALMKRLSIKELKEMAIDHEIALQLVPGDRIDDEIFFRLGEKLETTIHSYHGDYPFTGHPVPRSLVFSRKFPQEKPIQATYQDLGYALAGGGYSQPELNEILKSQKNRWTIFVYHHLYNNPAEIPHKLDSHTVYSLFTETGLFEQQIRLFRNSNYWVAAETDVFKYMKERKASVIKTEKYQNMIFLKVINTLDPNTFDVPLTVEYTTAAKVIRIEGSEADGTFSNKNGTFQFSVMPNREIIIQIIE